MNGNSSKQVLLSVLGIAILVVAVVGVSFAFFSYTKTGTQNNSIQTGEIYTYLLTGANMVLTDAMPVPAANEPETIQSAANTDIGKFSFTVVGSNDSDTAITYKVYLVPGTNPTERTTKLDNTDIGILVSAGNNSAVTLEGNVDQQHTTVTNDIDNGGMLIATGTFVAGTPANTTHSYDVNLWVRGATVTISDTDSNAKYCAHAGNAGGANITNTTETHGCEHAGTPYSQAWWAAKIKVVAGNPSYDYTIPTPASNGG